ncbi:uncharacterized protein I206_106975 [Kwoniella pini CBS 10737]|uniref:Cyclopropane-fatty-acyl-phospholipid synthase n=1 Tax=Kwoniella pini CBS 10737 TaxID=1296096 RepID=A0A1B9HZJ9_9TREE|nr:uncharacterized protein I206_05482 [Kwoniella pini CBS 10737]OCF48702.1 hypothetical protein I206_05482 [Kwoniella pini CBS 10737]
MDYAYALLDKGYIPDTALRPVIRQLCRKRLREIDHGSFGANHAAKMEFIKDLYNRPIATHTSEANEQHYEVPTSFHSLCMGPRMKYSSCLWTDPINNKSVKTLTEAEDLMLSSYCSDAKLGLGLRGVGNSIDGGEIGKEGEGLKILDLGCGWGSLGLFLAEHYPLAQIKMLSNSRTQKEYIDSKAAEKGFNNIEVITGDVNIYDFEQKEQFTHIMSIEMFEHMKSYPQLFQKISTWLKPKGNLFIHIFCHKSQPYHFEENDGWMSKTFFSGGTMPSFDLFTYFQNDLILKESKFLNGINYSKTLESWLINQDKNGKEAMKHLINVLGEEEGSKTYYRFRVFFIACSEFFALDGGETWGVGKYLFEKR